MKKFILLLTVLFSLFIYAEEENNCSTDLGECEITTEGDYTCKCRTFVLEEGEFAEMIWETKRGKTETSVCDDLLINVCNINFDVCDTTKLEKCKQMDKNLITKCYSNEISESDYNSMVSNAENGEWNVIKKSILMCCRNESIISDRESITECLESKSCGECGIHSANDSETNDNDVNSESKSSDGCSMFVI